MNVIREHWNERAALGVTAGTQDLIAKELEQRAILAEIRRQSPVSILEIGCGRGELARRIVRSYHHAIYEAVDSSPRMIEAAKRERTESSLRYAVADVALLPEHVYDCIITERMVINLPSWPLQHQALQAIAARLISGGRYLMVENSAEGLAAINRGRQRVGLVTIQEPWFNRYLHEEELAQVTCLRLVKCLHFSSTYYFLSRVLNAKWAQLRGREPAYDAPINQLALTLSSVGPWSQGRLWVWEKP